MKPDPEVARVLERLAAHGYIAVVGVTFEMFQPNRGIALLANGREVRFFLPLEGPEEVSLVERRRRARD